MYGSVETDQSVRFKFITATCVSMDAVKTQKSTEVNVKVYLVFFKTMHESGSIPYSK